ncbi:branched-chain amino acid transporter permease [Nitratifractor sp.]
MSEHYLFAAVLVLAAGNLLTRAVPFLFFARHRPPGWVLFVERNFPPVILTILIFYTLEGVDFTRVPYGLKEISAISVTMALHAWRSNYLLSIFGGTAFYMLLVQTSP